MLAVIFSSMQAPVIKFKPSLKQWLAYEKLNDSTTSFIGYGGSAFSGKSYLLCYWFTIMSIAYPGTGWGLGRKQITTLKKTTLITLFKVFQECGIDADKHYSYNQQLNIITFWNESQIFLIDTEYKPSDPLYTRFGGYELTGVAVDESPETTLQAIQILSTRIGRRKNNEYGLTAKFLETFNPDKGHVYQRYYKPWKDGKMPDNYAFIKALPTDNPSPEVAPYIARIRASGDIVTIERLIEGNFEYDDDPQRLFHDYDKILEIFTNEFIEAAGPKYLVADIAYEGSDLFVIGIWNGLVCEKIEAFDKIDETQVAKKINELRLIHKVPLSNVCYDADGLKTFVRQSAKTGYLSGATQFHNGGRAIGNENYYNLKAQCYFKLAELVNDSKIYIKEPKYRKQIIEELEQIKKRIRNDDNEKIRLESKQDLKLRLGRSPDFADMLMMRMKYEISEAKSYSTTPETLQTINY